MTRLLTSTKNGQAKFQDGVAGSIVTFPTNLEVDEKRMGTRIIFADGKNRDGVGDRLRIEGIDLWRHRSNPVVLWEHGKAGVQLPIAVSEDPDTKAYTVELDPMAQEGWAFDYFYQGTGDVGIPSEDEYDHALFCEQVFHLIVKRFLRGGSIGYQIVEAIPLAPDFASGGPPVQGNDLIRVLKLEHSVVTIPANGLTVKQGDPIFEEWRERAREVLCAPMVCGKSLAAPLRKAIEPYAAAAKVMSAGVETKGSVEVLVRWQMEDQVKLDAQKAGVKVGTLRSEMVNGAKVVTLRLSGDDSAVEQIIRGRHLVRAKAMSASNETSGGALRKPPQQGEKDFFPTPKDTEGEVSVPLNSDLSRTNIPAPRSRSGWVQEVKDIRKKYKQMSQQYNQGDKVSDGTEQGIVVRCVGDVLIVQVRPKDANDDDGIREWKVNQVAAKSIQGLTKSGYDKVYLGRDRGLYGELCKIIRELPNGKVLIEIDTGDQYEVRKEEVKNETKALPSESADVSPEKARKILKDGSVNGKPLTDKQRGMFGAIAGKSIQEVDVINLKPGDLVHQADGSAKPVKYVTGRIIVYTDGERDTINPGYKVQVVKSLGKSINVRWKQKVVKGYANVQMKFDVSGMDTKRQNEFVRAMKAAGYGEPSGGKWTGEGEEKALDAPLKSANYSFNLEPGKSVAEAIGNATNIGEKHGAKFMGNAKSIQGQAKANHMGEKTYQTYAAWKNACKAAGADRFEGNKDIANAFKGSQGIGEWDGETGVVYGQKSIKGNTMSVKTKSEMQQPAPVEEVPEEQGREFHMKESLGSQVMRRFHEDFSTLMKQYHEILPVLDHAEVKDFVTEKLKGWEKDLGFTEKSHKKWFKDVDPIEGSMEEDDKELGNDEAENADSDDVPVPSPDEAIEGMEKEPEEETSEEKALRIKQTKSIRSKYRSKAVPGYEEHQDKPGGDLTGNEIPNEPGKEEHQPKPGHDATGEEIPLTPGNEEEDGVKWFKALADHHRTNVTAAKGYLKELSETQDESFSQEHRMKAYYHAENLNKTFDEADKVDEEANVTNGEKGIKTDQPNNAQEEANVTNAEKGIRGAIKNAGCYLKDVANGQTFGEEQRQKALSCVKDLEGIDEEDKGTDADEPPQDEGMQTKALVVRKLPDGKYIVVDTETNSKIHNGYFNTEAEAKEELEANKTLTQTKAIKAQYLEQSKQVQELTKTLNALVSKL